MIVVVNYGIGNLDSVTRAFRKNGADVLVSSDASDIARADGIVLPGVGSFGEAMENLNARGLAPVLNRKVIEEKTPTLGICLGFQMFTNGSEEGGAAGLGWIEGETKRFRFEDAAGPFKIPQVGWNEVKRVKESPLFEGIYPEAGFYFAHSYYVTCRDSEVVIGTTDYGHEYVSAVQRDNLFGMQFHPEKSHACGLRLIRNFIEYSHHA